MILSRRVRSVLASAIAPLLLLAACGDGGVDPDAAASKQAAIDAAANPNDLQLRRKAVDAATAARARWTAPGTLPLVPVSMANLPDGRVELVAMGEERALRRLQDWLWQGPPNAQVTEVRCERAEHAPLPRFEVR